MQKKSNFIPSAVPDKVGFNGVKQAISPYIFTPAGSSLLENLTPVFDPENVDILCRQTSEMKQLLEQDKLIPLSTLESIDKWLDQSKAEGSILNSDVFPPIREHASTARIIRNFFKREYELSPVLWSIAENLEQAEQLEESIKAAITDEGNLRDDASPELQTIRKRLISRRHTLRSTIEKIYKKFSGNGMTSDEGPTIRSGRMVIPIQAEYKRKIDGFIHDVSASGQTVYLEPVEALQINNDIRQMEAEEKREIERILQRLTSIVRKNRSLLKHNADILGQLDLIHARTKLGLSWNGVIPRKSDNHEWIIHRALNPNLLLKNRRLPENKQERIIPLDLTIEQNEQGIVISGPNAGGKSVALKTVGVLCCMYQAGIPLPVQADSSLPVITGIALDMGDDQSIEQDLSTFSSRLKWMRETLNNIDEHFLVLIDEAGTGTDPEEGGALFQAFIENVIKQGAALIATTHHGALKVFAHDHPALTNGAMEFDQETLSPAYRFRKGNPGSSYAFEIAGRMNLPETMLGRSRELLGDQRDRMADLLLSLEHRLQDAEEAHNKYDQLRREAEQQEKEYREKKREINENRNEKIAEAYREADRIMKEANRKIEQAVEKIVEEGNKDRKKIRRIRRDVEKHKKQIRQKLQETEQEEEKQAQKQDSGESPRVGDYVTVSGGDTSGELIEKEGNRAVVLAGGLKIKTKYNNLVKSRKSESGSKIDRWKASSYSRSFSEKTVKPSLDLRGMRGDEAVKELMHYIDRVVAAGLGEVDIIHGKGEGILKKLVHEYLEKRQEVRKYEQAPWERGGPGCTVVRLND